MKGGTRSNNVNTISNTQLYIVIFCRHYQIRSDMKVILNW